MRACVCVCVCVLGGRGGGGCCFYFNLHVRAFIKALMYMILWFNHNVMAVMNVLLLFFC